MDYSPQSRAWASLKDWRNEAEDQDQRKDLKKWHKRFGEELRRRKGDWRLRATKADRKEWERRDSGQPEKPRRRAGKKTGGAL